MVKSEVSPLGSLGAANWFPSPPSLLGWHLTTVARKLLHGFPHARTTVFSRLRASAQSAGIGIVDPLHAFIARSWCIHYSHSSTYSYVQYSLCIQMYYINLYITYIVGNYRWCLYIQTGQPINGIWSNHFGMGDTPHRDELGFWPQLLSTLESHVSDQINHQNLYQ